MKVMIEYCYLSQKAKKYVLLALFIREIVNYQELEKKPYFYRSDYSPVVNNVIAKRIIMKNDRFQECADLISETEGERTLIYFATVAGKFGMYRYIDFIISKEQTVNNIPEEMQFFIEWVKEETHEERCVVKALEHRYLIHNGQIPVGTRIFQLDQYGKEDGFNKMLCTSILLEGVNTILKISLLFNQLGSMQKRESVLVILTFLI